MAKILGAFKLNKYLCINQLSKYPSEMNYNIIGRENEIKELEYLMSTDKSGEK